MSEGKYNGDGVKHYRSLDRETRKKFRRLHRRSIKSLSSLSFSSLFTGNNIIDENYKSRRQSMQKSKHTMNMHPVVEKAMERMTRRSTSAELPPCHAPLTPSSMRLPHSPSPRVSCSSSRPAPARCAADSQPPQVTQAFSRKCGSSIYSPANRARSKKYTPDSNKSRSMRVRATTATSSSPRQGRRRYRLSLPQYQNGGEGLGADGFKLGGKGISVDTGINFVKRRNDAIEIDDDGKKEDDPSDSNDSKDGTSDTNRADKPLKKEAHAVEIKDNHARNVEDAGNGNGVNNDGTDNNSGALAMFVTLNPALQNLSASDVSPPSSSSSPPSLSPSPSSLSLSPRFSSVPPPSLQSKTSDSITKATHKLKKPNKDELFMNSVMKTKDGKENWAKWEENEDTEKRRNIGHHDCTSNDNASATEAVVDTVNINRCDEKENKYGDSSNIDRGNSSSHGQDDLYNANSSPSIIIPVEKGGKEEIARECADRSESCRGNSPCAMSRSQPASSPASPPSPTRCADKDRNNHNHNCHGVDTPSTHSLPLPPSSSHQASFSNLVSITDDKWALPEDEHAGRLGVTVLYNQGQAPTTRNPTDMHHLKEQLNENGITRNEFDLMAIDRLSKKDQAINYLNYHLMYASVEDRLKMAHILIKDAKDTHDIKNFRFDMDPLSLWIYKIMQTTVYKHLMMLIVFCHCMLSVWEPPTNLDSGVYATDGYRSSMLSGLVMSAEGFVIAIYLLDAAADTCKRGIEFAPESFKWRCNVLLTMLLLVDFLCEVFLNVTWCRVTRILRPIKLFCHVKSVRRVLHATIATMPYIFDVLVFLCLFVITFAIIGVHLFFDIYFEPSDISDTSGDDGRGTSINERIALRFNFKDIQASATSLIVLLTTENWPDVGRPAFDVAPISLIYFILFLMLAMLLILSVPISVTVDAYKRFRKKQVIKDRMTERRALLAAFHCLDTQRVGYLTSHQIDELLLHMLGDLGPHELQFFRMLADVDDNGTIPPSEFFVMCEIITFSKIKQEVAFRDRWYVAPLVCSGIWDACAALSNCISRSFNLNYVVQSLCFRYIVGLSLLVNSVNLAMYRYNMTEFEFSLLESIDFWCLVVFTAEMIIKIMAIGMDKYWSKKWNKFEGFLVILGMGTEVMILFLSLHNSNAGTTIDETESSSATNDIRSISKLSNIERWARILKIARATRILRMLRLFKMSKNFERINTIAINLINVLPTLMPFFLFLMVLTYMYAIVGIEIYAKCFTFAEDEKPDWYDEMANFSTFPMALLSLFQVFTTSNWHEVLVSLWESSNGRTFSRSVAIFYLTSFYFFAVLLWTNHIIALVWEIFTVFFNSKYDKLMEKVNEDQDEDIEVSDSEFSSSSDSQVMSSSGNESESESESESDRSWSLSSDIKKQNRLDTKSLPSLEGQRDSAVRTTCNPVYSRKVVEARDRDIHGKAEDGDSYCSRDRVSSSGNNKREPMLGRAFQKEAHFRASLQSKTLGSQLKPRKRSKRKSRNRSRHGNSVRSLQNGDNAHGSLQNNDSSSRGSASAHCNRWSVSNFVGCLRQSITTRLDKQNDRKKSFKKKVKRGKYLTHENAYDLEDEYYDPGDGCGAHVSDNKAQSIELDHLSSSSRSSIASSVPATAVLPGVEQVNTASTTPLSSWQPSKSSLSASTSHAFDSTSNCNSNGNAIVDSDGDAVNGANTMKHVPHFRPRLGPSVLGRSGTANHSAPLPLYSSTSSSPASSSSSTLQMKGHRPPPILKRQQKQADIIQYEREQSALHRHKRKQSRVNQRKYSRSVRAAKTVRALHRGLGEGGGDLQHMSSVESSLPNLPISVSPPVQVPMSVSLSSKKSNAVPSNSHQRSPVPPSDSSSLSTSQLPPTLPVPHPRLANIKTNTQLLRQEQMFSPLSSLAEEPSLAHAVSPITISRTKISKKALSHNHRQTQRRYHRGVHTQSDLLNPQPSRVTGPRSIENNIKLKEYREHINENHCAGDKDDTRNTGHTTNNISLNQDASIASRRKINDMNVIGKEYTVSVKSTKGAGVGNEEADDERGDEGGRGSGGKRNEGFTDIGPYADCNTDSRGNSTNIFGLCSETDDEGGNISIICNVGRNTDKPKLDRHHTPASLPPVPTSTSVSQNNKSRSRRAGELERKHNKISSHYSNAYRERTGSTHTKITLAASHARYLIEQRLYMDQDDIASIDNTVLNAIGPPSNVPQTFNPRKKNRDGNRQ